VSETLVINMTRARAVLRVYCHLWYVWLYQIFQHYLIKTRLSEKKIIEPKMCVLIFSTNCVWHISHSKNNSARCYHKYT